MVWKRTQWGRVVWMGGAALVTLALVAGIAYAAIPGEGGVIQGCYKTANGQLRVIDSSTGSCGDSETPLAWNQTGPQGIPGRDGAAGSAVGFALVGAGGAIDASQSHNVTQANVTHPAPGLYCFGGLSFTPRTAVVTGQSGIDGAGNPTNVDTLATVSVATPGVTFPLGCAETDVVRVRTIAATAGTALVDRGFRVLFED